MRPRGRMQSRGTANLPGLLSVLFLAAVHDGRARCPSADPVIARRPSDMTRATSNLETWSTLPQAGHAVRLRKDTGAGRDPVYRLKDKGGAAWLERSRIALPACEVVPRADSRRRGTRSRE